MTKQELLNKLNKKIDDLILNGKRYTNEYKRLCKLHRQIVNEIEEEESYRTMNDPITKVKEQNL